MSFALQIIGSKHCQFLSLGVYVCSWCHCRWTNDRHREKIFEIYWGPSGSGVEGWFAYFLHWISLVQVAQGLFGDIIERV